MQGGGVVRTKHMQTRMQLVLEVVKENQVMIKYINMKEMNTDGFTKVLSGEEFKIFMNAVLGKSFLSKWTGEHWIYRELLGDDNGVSPKGSSRDMHWVTPERSLEGVGYDAGTRAGCVLRNSKSQV
jgi:hypothetical protein